MSNVRDRSGGTGMEWVGIRPESYRLRKTSILLNNVESHIRISKSCIIICRILGLSTHCQMVLSWMLKFPHDIYSFQPCVAPDCGLVAIEDSCAWPHEILMWNRSTYTTPNNSHSCASPNAWSHMRGRVGHCRISHREL